MTHRDTKLPVPLDTSKLGPISVIAPDPATKYAMENQKDLGIYTIQDIVRAFRAGAASTL